MLIMYKIFKIYANMCEYSYFERNNHQNVNMEYQCDIRKQNYPTKVDIHTTYYRLSKNCKKYIFKSSNDAHL